MNLNQYRPGNIFVSVSKNTGPFPQTDAITIRGKYGLLLNNSFCSVINSIFIICGVAVYDVNAINNKNRRKDVIGNIC